MTTAKPTGTCTACGRMDLRLTSSGNIPNHGPSNACPGAGQPPKEQQ